MLTVVALKAPPPHTAAVSNLGNWHCRSDALTNTAGQYHTGGTFGSPSVIYRANRHTTPDDAAKLPFSLSMIGGGGGDTSPI